MMIVPDNGYRIFGQQQGQSAGYLAAAKSDNLQKLKGQAEVTPYQVMPKIC